MTLLFNDGFDWMDYTNDATVQAQLAYDGWVPASYWGTQTYTGGVGLYGGRYLRFNSTVKGSMTRAISGAPATGIMGFLFRTQSLTGGGAVVQEICAFVDGSTIQVALRLHTDGSISVARGTTLLGSATAIGVIAANTWYFIEIKALIHASAGTVEVKVDNVQKIALTGQNTRNSATAQITGFSLHNGLQVVAPTYGAQDFDDVYFCDTAGSVNNDFLGACRTEMLVPNANILNAFTPSAGSNYQCVDEIPLSATADYNSAASALEDRFTTAGMTTTPTTVHGVSLVQFALKTDAGTCTARNRLTSGASTGNGTTTAVPTSLAAIRDVFELDPNGSVAWTPTTVNAARPGYERLT